MGVFGSVNKRLVGDGPWAGALRFWSNSRRRERHRLESVGIRRTRCAAAVALRPTTFRSRPVASVATLPSERESIIGVLKLKDEIPPGLVE